jgi:hypothetical protein
VRQCDDIPPEELLQAIDEFNTGRWFECHETLEELWVGAEGEMRNCFQGILQVAVSLHHWREGNYAGALLLLERGANNLRMVRSACLGLDISGLVVDADLMRAALLDLGKERMFELSPELIPLVRFVACP